MSEEEEFKKVELELEMVNEDQDELDGLEQLLSDIGPIELNVVDESSSQVGDDPDAALDFLSSLIDVAGDDTDVMAGLPGSEGLGKILGGMAASIPSKRQFDTASLMNLLRKTKPELDSAKDVLLSVFPFKDEFYEVGKPKIRVVYVPIFQSLCQGNAAERFNSSIEYSEGVSTELAIDMSLKGIGANLSSSSTFSISFTIKGPIRGSFQLSLPAVIETRTYKHRSNDDLTGTRTAVVEIGSEASLIVPEEADFTLIEGLDYRVPTRFGALRNLTKTDYEFKTDQSLKGSIGFPLLKDAGEFSLEVTVKSNSGIGVSFETTKEGVFEQSVGTDGPLAHIFDDANLRQ